MLAKEFIGMLIIIMGALTLVDMFVPMLDFIFEVIPFHVVFGIALMIIGIYIIKGRENSIEQRKDIGVKKGTSGGAKK